MFSLSLYIHIYLLYNNTVNYNIFQVIQSYMYCVGRNIIKPEDKELHELFVGFAEKAKLLSNAALFRLRQNFTARGKAILSANEEEVLREIELVISLTGKARPKSIIPYTFLEKLMRVTKNPDFFTDLPMQTSQNVLKERIRDFKGWLSSLKEFKKDPSKFTGKPRIPGYTKSPLTTFTLSNQDAVIYREGGACFLKLPKTKTRLKIQTLPSDARLKEVKVKPFYGNFEVLYTYETNNLAANAGLCASAAIDFGIENIAAIVTNNGASMLVKGGVLKAKNQWFNKRRAELVSILTKGHKTTARPSSGRLENLSLNRALFLHDAWHQISCRVVSFCLKNKVSTLYLGRNTFWKQGSRMSKSSNQAFVSLPLYSLQQMITYKAERAGIIVRIQEESYTSKASLLDGDHIPTYGVDDEKAIFSGRRIGRGLYRSSDGTILNADIHAAANILRKAEQNAFSKSNNFDFLKNFKVVNYTDLHKSIALDGIAAA